MTPNDEDQRATPGARPQDHYDGPTDERPWNAAPTDAGRILIVVVVSLVIFTVFGLIRWKAPR
jgi:hypothetical protein